jgi:hypothetical protein
LSDSSGFGASSTGDEEASTQSGEGDSIILVRKEKLIILIP